MHPYYHSLSSQKTHGGEYTDYMEIHDWFDRTKSAFCHYNHRALRHHQQGIDYLISLKGTTILNLNNKQISIQTLGEQHCLEDCKRIPNAEDWIKIMDKPDWLPDVWPSFDDWIETESKRFKTKPEYILPLYQWFAQVESWSDDLRAMAFRYHSFGIFECEQIFGTTLKIQDNKQIPTRILAERWVNKVLNKGVPPTASDWLKRIRVQKWMNDAEVYVET